MLESIEVQAKRILYAAVLGVGPSESDFAVLAKWSGKTNVTDADVQRWINEGKYSMCYPS